MTRENGLNQGRNRYLILATCVMVSLDSEALQTLPDDSNLQLGLKIISPNTHTHTSFFLSMEEHCSFLFKTGWVYHIIKSSEIPFRFSVFAPNSTPLSCGPFPFLLPLAKLFISPCTPVITIFFWRTISSFLQFP